MLRMIVIVHILIPPHVGNTMLRNLERLEDRTQPVIMPDDVSLQQIFEYPTLITSIVPADDGRIFFTDKEMGVRVIRDGALLTNPFVQLPAFVEGEQGVAGMALDPNFAQNGYLYVYYTYNAPSGPINRVSRFTANGDVAAANSEVVLFQLNRPSSFNHIGGALHFGPDGKLYIAVGDHNAPNDAQSLDSLVGKILRINPDGTIPPDNPFFLRANGLNKAIWALGFRNPFTFDISQRTGLLYVNDVGLNTWEELNDVRPGGNYGWPRQEGLPVAGVISPIHTYQHGDQPPQGSAITGGVFYEPDIVSMPDRYVGRYFFGEYGTRYIGTYDPPSKQVEIFALQFPDSLLDFDVDANGNMLVLGIGGRPLTPNIVSSRIYMMKRGGAAAPIILDQPSDTFISTVQPARFIVSAAGQEPFSYEWTKNGTIIPDATGPELLLTNLTAADDGSQIQVRVRNAVGAVQSRVAMLRVTTDLPPTLQITTPMAGTLFQMGQRITFSGTASDPETGALPDDALSWRIEYHTNTVARPFAEGIIGPMGEVVLPTTTPYTRTDVFYRLILTARDPAGLSESITLDLLPQLTEIRVESNIPNTVALDGRLIGVGEVVSAVLGVEREVSARREVIVDGNLYVFDRWSDGSPRVHRITAMEAMPTLRAEYRLVGPAPRAGLTLSSRGVAELHRADGSIFRVEPFGANSSSTLQATTADVTGDGVEDLIIGAGPGSGPVVVIYDGATETEIARFFAFESSFNGGVMVTTGDVDEDGIAELLVSPDVGGGPVVAVYRAGDFLELGRFFGIDDLAFRGGARIELSDINGDGPADLLVSAGAGGGPRIAIYDGGTLLGAMVSGERPPKLIEDFFAFEPTLRNGAYLAGGDLQGDGVGELIVGGGPGGAPRIRVLDGTLLLNGAGVDGAILGDFFAGDPARRDGVRVTAADYSGDGLAEIASAVGNEVRIYAPATIAEAEPAPQEQSTPFGDSPFSVFVG